MRKLKKVSLGVLSIILLLVSLNISSGHFLQIQVGSKAQAATYNYYYNKYTTVMGYSPASSSIAQTWDYNSYSYIGTSYYWDDVQQKYVLSGNISQGYSDNNVGKYLMGNYSMSGDLVILLTTTRGTAGLNTGNCIWLQSVYRERAGVIVQANIIAQDGTYPNNGLHSDGYWYVKGAVANQNPTILITSPTQNGTLPININNMKGAA